MTAVTINTNKGSITLLINEEKAPITIKQRIVSTQTKDCTALNHILTEIQTIIKNNLEKFNSKLEAELTIHLQGNLEKIQKFILVSSTVEPVDTIEFLLCTLNNIQNYIPILKQTITTNILLDKSMVKLKKNSTYQEEISTEIVNLATV